LSGTESGAATVETGGGECPYFDTHKEGAASGVSPCLDENRQNNPPRRVEVEGEGEGERELSLGGLFCLFSSLYKGCARSGTLLVCQLYWSKRESSVPARLFWDTRMAALS